MLTPSGATFCVLRCVFLTCVALFASRVQCERLHECVNDVTVPLVFTSGWPTGQCFILMTATIMTLSNLASSAAKGSITPRYLEVE